jgi:hypothetical protein
MSCDDCQYLRLLLEVTESIERWAVIVEIEIDNRREKVEKEGEGRK